MPLGLEHFSGPNPLHVAWESFTNTTLQKWHAAGTPFRFCSGHSCQRSSTLTTLIAPFLFLIPHPFTLVKKRALSTGDGKVYCDSRSDLSSLMMWWNTIRSNDTLQSGELKSLRTTKQAEGWPNDTRGQLPPEPTSCT
jgi:hypothetical protein